VAGEHPIEHPIEHPVEHPNEHLFGRGLEHPYDVVLFDLGGVLVDPGGVGEMRELSGIASDEELWRRWLSCPWVQRFEAGRCSSDEFAAGVVDDWGLAVSPDAFLAAFTGWQTSPYPGADRLVAEVADVVRVGYLSNTNPVQWDAHLARSPLVGGFDFGFTSFELGLVKPDRAIFDAVAARLGVGAPGRVLFLDDNAVNVDGAAASGFVARHVRGVDEARHVLMGEGVLAH
jgi:putative hydrolase of the HAD superfamily